MATLALREARIGIVAALIAALGTALSEVAAIVIVGGNVYGYDQTLASAALYEANAAHYAEARRHRDRAASAMILILMGGWPAPAPGRRHSHALPVGDVSRREPGAARALLRVRAA